MRYQIFKRTWWKENPAWPNGLEPCAGERTDIEIVDTVGEAISFCKAHNAEVSDRLGMKYEFERIS